MRLTKSTASTQFLNLKYLMSFLSASTSHPSSWSCSGTIWSWVSGGVPPRQGTHLLSARLVAIQLSLPLWGRAGWGLSTLPIVARSASSGLVFKHAFSTAVVRAEPRPHSPPPPPGGGGGGGPLDLADRRALGLIGARLQPRIADLFG